MGIVCPAPGLGGRDQVRSGGERSVPTPPGAGSRGGSGRCTAPRLGGVAGRRALRLVTARPGPGGGGGGWSSITGSGPGARVLLGPGEDPRQTQRKPQLRPADSCAVKMKVLWVLWALALLSGCQGQEAKTSSEERVMDPELWNSEPARAWEMAMGRFQGYLEQLQARAEDLKSEVHSSQIVRDLRGLMTDTLTELNAYKAEVDQELTPMAEETRARLAKELSAAQARLGADMEDVGARLTQYHREFHAVVNHNIDEVRNRVSAYLRKMRKRLGRDFEELQTRLTTYQTGAKEGVERGLGSLKRLVPALERVQEQNKKRVASLGALAGERLQSHLDQVRSKVDEVRAKVDEQSAQLQSQLQGFHDRLKAWFQPLATDLQRQWASLVDKVQEAINPNGKPAEGPANPIIDN